MKKVLLTATVQSHICQFHKPLVRMLHAQGYEVHVAARNNLAEKNGLKLDFVDKVFDIPFSRSPKSKDNIKAYKCLCNILKEEHYEAINCNTPMGGVITRLAAKKYRKKGTKVIYTAHGFHFYKGAPKSAWLIYYPIEFIFGKLFTDKLITVSDDDYKFAQKKHLCKNVYRIHSVGINESKYHAYSVVEVSEQRKKMGIVEHNFIAICTGELNANKRQRVVIDALPSIVKAIPNFKLLLAGNGPLHDELQSQICALHMENYAKLIGYCTNLEEYVKISDIAISASKREGMPMNLLEAMACGKPVIGSINRGHKEFIQSEKNGFLVSEEDISGQIANNVIRLHKDANLYSNCSSEAYETAKRYLESAVEKELFDIYFKD